MIRTLCDEKVRAYPGTLLGTAYVNQYMLAKLYEDDITIYLALENGGAR